MTGLNAPWLCDGSGGEKKREGGEPGKPIGGPVGESKPVGDNNSVESWRISREPISYPDVGEVNCRGPDPKRLSAMPAKAALNVDGGGTPVGLDRLGVRTPSGFLLNDSRIPPLTSPFNVCPYISFNALVAKLTSSNCERRLDKPSTNHNNTYLDKTHRAIGLLPKAQLPVSGGSRKQSAQRLLKICRRMTLP